jgi:DNA-damage-inducible protein J
MMTVDVRSRVEPELKEQAAAVLKASGLDVSTAICCRSHKSATI